MKDEIQDISPWGNIRDVKSPIENIYVHQLLPPSFLTAHSGSP